MAVISPTHIKVSVKTQGGPELLKALNALEKTISRKIQIDAMTEAVEPMRQHAAALAPRRAQGGEGRHLADDIVTSATTMKKLERLGRLGETVVAMGPSKSPNDHFYGMFLEYGTRRSRAFPFMRPAFDVWASRTVNFVMTALWNRVKKEAEKHAPQFRPSTRAA